MASETGWLESIEAKAPELFLAAGGLYVVFVVNRILSTYTGTSFTYAEVFAWVSWIVLGFGLLGLYPALVERRPYLSRVAAFVLVVPVVCSAIVAVGIGILEPTGILTEAPGLLGLAPFAAIVTMYVALALFGIAALLADVHPKPVGGLMLAIALLYPLWMTVLNSVPTFVANGIDLIAYLAIGVLLLTADLPTDGAEPPAESVA
jgi:hypothetical protein